MSAVLRERLGITPGSLEHGRLLTVLRYLEPEPNIDVAIGAFRLLEDSSDAMPTELAVRLARPLERWTKGQVLVIDVAHDRSWMSWVGDVVTDLSLMEPGVLRVYRP